MNGYMVLTRKELRESWRTYRLLIAVAVFAFAAIVGPLMTHMMPDLLRSGVGNAHVHITMDTPTAADAVASYLSNMVQLPMLAVILLALGAIAEERGRGIGALILYRPVSRAAYLLAKLTAQGAVLLAALLVGAGLAFYYIALLFTGARLGPFLALNAGIAVIVLDVLALTLACSTLLRSGVAAGGAAFALYLVYSFLPQLWAPLDSLLPGAIARHAPEVLTGTWGAGDLMRPLLGGLLLAALCIAGALLTLRRQDV